ncbi:MAG TPA: CARDB domain-containing protein [Chitinophagaceae bacterium]|nr:CARDB domain-containing protein [Chitinophagaceae bacterium]
MKPLFNLLTATRVIHPLDNRAAIIMLVVMLAITSICRAQANTSTKPVKETTEIKNPGINTQIKVADKKLGTTPKVIDKDIVSKYKVVTPTKGKDLTVVIDKVVDNSTSSLNKYTVQYTLINCGTEDIDITGVTMQGKFSGNKPGGGTSLTPDVLKGNNVLKPGSYFNGTMTAASQELYTTENLYKYVLMADASNKIAEANENNNTAEATVKGHLPPPPSVCDPANKQDIIFTAASVTKYVEHLNRMEFSYTVKNVGLGYATLTHISVKAEITALGGKVVSTAQTCQCLGKNASKGPKILQPGESYTFVNDEFPYSYCSLDGLESGVWYTLNLTIETFCPEVSTDNNRTAVQFKKP